MNNSSTFKCFVAGIDIAKKLATKIDEFQCFLGNFELFLFNIGFGYICVGFLILIIIISLFGGIKEDYRWFILLQSLWDLLISVYFQCVTTFREIILGDESSCSLQRWVSEKNLNKMLQRLLLTNVYSALFLLTFTRFLCLYFINFYDRLTHKRRIAYLIISLNIFFVGIHIDDYFEYLTAQARLNWKENCRSSIKEIEKLMSCLKSKEYETFSYNILEFLRKIFVTLVVFKPIACLAFSVFANFMIIGRIIKQAAFQIKHNRQNFYGSLRVTIVITFQTIMNICIFFITFVQFLTDLAVKFNVLVILAGGRLSCKELSLPGWSCIYLDLPFWYSGKLGLIDANQTFIQMRIFIESIIVLSIMTGYREAIGKFVKFIFSFIKDPKEFWKNRNNRVVPY